MFAHLSLICLSCFLPVIGSSPGSIQLENGRYQGVVIAIAEDVPEDDTLIQDIKDIFMEASTALYRATRYVCSISGIFDPRL